MYDNPILWPREQLRYTNEREVDLFINGREVDIIESLPNFTVPDDPTWTENPYGSRAWQMYFATMGWLYAGEQGYKEGRFPDFPQYAKDMILDFMEDNPTPSTRGDNLIWHDGGNAFRMGNLAYFYENYFRPGNPNGVTLTFTPEEQQLFADGLQDHLDQVLYQLSRSEWWAMSNHRFFHAMGLATYATVFGNAEGTPFYEENHAALLQQALDTIDEILGNIIDLNLGVSLEQSFGYHRLGMGLVLEAKEYIVDKGYELGRDYDAVLEKMLEFDILSRRPGTAFSDNYLSEVGDSGYGTAFGAYYPDQIVSMGLISPVSKYVLSKGAEGTRPADLIDYSDAGYLIIRPQYAWEHPRDTRVLIDVTTQVVSHGHYDNTNVLLSSYGQRILVDSGGPYSYDSKPEFGFDQPFKEAYFKTSEAHNVLVVNGESFDADTEVLAKQTADNFSYAAMRHFGYAGIEVTRHVLVLKDGVTFIFDTAENSGEGTNTYELNWHFDPKAIGVDAGSYTSFSAGNVFVDGAFLSGSDTSYQVVSGRKGDDPQGWVTSAAYTAVAAPVLEMLQNGNDAWFASAFATSLTEASLLGLNAQKTADGFLASLSFEGMSWQVTVSGGVATVIQSDAPPPSGIIGDEGPNRLVGTSSTDSIYGMGGNDTLYGMGGNDLLHGGEGLNYLFGGDGDDEMIGGSDADILYGEAGANTLRGNGGDDRLVGGDTGRERLEGGDGNDSLYGGADHDYLDGGNGNDRLDGGSGIDTIFGGAGADTITAGDNSDSVFGDAGNDNIRGGSGNDTIQAGSDDDTVHGDNGHDSIQGNDGNDLLFGESNEDTLRGGNGDDRLFGGLGHDSMNGDDGNDQLRGEDGNDTLSGGAGDDRLWGGTGADMLWGNAGADIFAFTLPAESTGLTTATMDIIRDFNPLEGDQIDLSALPGVLNFIGMAGFSGFGNEVRYQHTTVSTLVSVDLNGDRAADMQFRLGGLIALENGDFAL